MSRHAELSPHRSILRDGSVGAFLFWLCGALSGVLRLGYMLTRLYRFVCVATALWGLQRGYSSNNSLTASMIAQFLSLGGWPECAMSASDIPHISHT